MNPTLDEITKLYVATFNRAPDAAGLNYWLNSGLTLEEIAQSFFDNEETQILYPAETSTTAFVTAVYRNLFNRDPDQAGLEYWVGELASGNISKQHFILAVINGAQNTETSQDQTILENKKTVGMAFANAGLNDVPLAKLLMAGVDATEDSVNNSLVEIENEQNNDDTTGDDTTGDDTTGDDTTGDDTTGDDTTGDDTTGDDTTGDDTTGDDTTGDDTTGDDTTGDDTTGDDTTGDDTTGDDTTGDDTTGDDTTGNDTTGDDTTGDDSTGDDTTGDDTTGDDTTGDDSTGDDTTGDDTTGDDTTGDDTTGDDTTGDDTTGDDTTGDDTTGDDTTGDDTTGDDTTGGDTTGCDLADSPLTLEQMTKLAQLVWLNDETGILSTASIREAVIAETGADAYYAAFEAQMNGDGCDEISTADMLGREDLANLPDTVETAESLIYGTEIHILKNLDYDESIAIGNFTYTNSAALEAYDTATWDQYVDLVVNAQIAMENDPVISMGSAYLYPGLTLDQIVQKIVVKSTIDFVGLATDPDYVPTGMFDGYLG